jgi:endonuclease/exonuclease/phosphatase family metal-dependent hydrolase
MAGAATFTLLSWNVQAERMRGRGHNGDDRSALEACLRHALGDHGSAGPDILILLELQRCKRRVRGLDCRYCTAGTCRQAHAEWVLAALAARGYEGDFHRGAMAHTVGLFYSSAFERAASDGRLCFASFDDAYGVGAAGGAGASAASHKGAVLALLRHRATGGRLLVAAVHLSVPKDADGALDTRRPLSELAQLRAKLNDVLRREGPAPLLLAGDFNAIPVSGAGLAPPDVYARLTRAPEWALSSAYASVLGAEPRATAWGADGFEGCIDYVLTSAGLRATGVLAPPAGRSAADEWLSDHLPLAAALAFDAP